MVSQYFLQFFLFWVVGAKLCNSGEENQIKIIKEIIHDASIYPQQKCVSYGLKNPHKYQTNKVAGDHQHSIHVVCNSITSRNKKLFVTALVGRGDLNKGQKGHDLAKELLKHSYHSCKCDEAGHIIPNELGGSGHYHNLFAQDHNLNGVLWNTYCRRISKFLNEATTSTREVTMELHFVYFDNTHPIRPSGYFFNFTYEQDKKVVKSDCGFLENESHDKGEWGECIDAEGQNLLFIKKVDYLYWNRRTCAVQRVGMNFFYGPTKDHELTKMAFDNIGYFKAELKK